MKRPAFATLLKFRRLFPILAGGAVLQFSLSGCDPEVRQTVLTGVQTSLTGLVTSIMNAFFLSLADTASSVTSQPVVQAAFDHLQTWLS